jgi:hypothetical protein
MKRNYGLFFSFVVLLVTAIFTFAACDNNGPSNLNVKAPPATVANAAAVKAYFQSIWGDLPADWKSFFLEYVVDTEDLVPPANLDAVDQQVWNEMYSGWANFRDDLAMLINDYINAGKSPSDFISDNTHELPSDDSAVAAAPTASPAAGAVVSGTAITLSTSTSGATIRYTTNGTNPTSTTGIVYSASSKPTITTETTIKAIAVKSGMSDSDVSTAAYTINTTPDGATVKAYFESIWDGIPPAWQTFFATMWAEEGEDGGGEVSTSLEEIDNELWDEMADNWDQYQNFWPMIAAQIDEGKSPIAAPPVWPLNGTEIKSYVEGIWDDLTADWQDYYLETITDYYNYNHTENSINPANLAAVPDEVWTYMKTAWNGSKWKPEDAQSILEHLALAINLGMSPDDEGLEYFIYAG